MTGTSALPILIAALKSQAGLSQTLGWNEGQGESLMQLAASHGMWGVLDRHWPCGDDLPPEAARLRFAISAMAARNARRNAELRQDAFSTVELLAASGIRAVLLKGAAFIAEDPEAAPWRVLADIDILVASEESRRAYDLLLAHGYASGEAPDRYREEDHHHLSPLQVPGSGHAVELHTRLVWDAARDPVPAGAVLDSARPASDELPDILIPSPEHRLAHLVAHAQIGDRNHAAGQLVLKDIADLTMLAPCVTDWEAIGIAFARTGCTAEWLGFLAAAKHLLDEAAPAVPVDTRAGSAWAARAVATLEAPEQGRNRLLLHILADYMRRIIRDPRNVALAVRTLIDPQRRSGFFGTQYRRWRR